MQPTYVELPQMKIAGLGARFISILSPNKTNATVIPALWHDFMQQSAAIPHKIGDGAYGLVEMLPATAAKADPAEMFYIAGTQVLNFDELPAAFLQRTLPAGRYARFTHKGKLDTLGATARWIYTEWLPTSGQKLRPVPHLERYDQRFKPDSAESEFDLLVPVE